MIDLFLFQNEHESDWCYSCYSLIFTSGSVIGKQLIVMVTNTESHFGQNHFNLQIPGSGGNLFNQCSDHFPNSNFLSASFGYVSQRSECANLSIGAQPGCYWRFDWFNNADNPDVNFTQVLCPTALVEKILPRPILSISSKILCSSNMLLFLCYSSCLFTFFYSF